LAVALAISAAQAPPPSPGVQATSPAPPSAPATVWTDDQPITRLFQNLGEDLQRLPSLDSVRLLGAGSAGTLAIRGTDDNLASWATREGTSVYTPFGRVLGEGWVQTTAALGTYAAGKLTRHAAATHIGGDLIRAQFLNGVVTTTLKVAVDRTRPTGGQHAFPSGHTSASFASAAVLQGHFGWKVGGPAYAIAGLVGWTRVRDRAHWMSDVFMGATLGTIAGRTVTRSHVRPTWSLVPTATPGGAALFIVKNR
jgi:membrane-associated phospholipid phosphatase